MIKFVHHIPSLLIQNKLLFLALNHLYNVKYVLMS